MAKPIATDTSALLVETLVEEGDLTPSMKLKRKVVTQKYREQLDAFYQG